MKNLLKRMYIYIQHLDMNTYLIVLLFSILVSLQDDVELPDSSVAVIDVGTNSTCYSIRIESDSVFEAIEVLQATIIRADPPITIDASSKTASILIADSTSGKGK